MPGNEQDGSLPGDRLPEAAVRPLERGLSVLRAMSVPGCERARPGDLVRATGLARSTVDRVVATLGRLGHLRFDGQEVTLAPQLMELGNAYLSASGLPDALAPHAGRLADELDESVSLAVPDQDGVRFIVQVTRRRTMSLAFRIGDALPAERCAPGALFASSWGPGRWDTWRARHTEDPYDLAFPAVPPSRVPSDEGDFRHRAEEAVTRGWALDDQLIEPGLVAVAVPVRGPRGDVVCALSAVSHVSRHDARGLAETVLPQLHSTAKEMEDALAESGAGTGTGAGTGAEVGTRSGTGTVPVGAAPTGGGADDGTTGTTGTDAPAPLPDPGGGPLPEAKQELGSGFLQSLARGLAVLRALADARGDGLPLTVVARSTGLPRATARRSLLALERLGYVESTGRLFRPLPRVLALGHASLTGLAFPAIVQPHLRQLVDRVHESASVTVLDGQDILYVARVATIRIMSANIDPGTRLPAYATAMGRVLLAGLPPAELVPALEEARPSALTRHTVTSVPELAALVTEVTETGYSTVTDELEEGLRSVAVPVRSADGRTVAALNIARHSAAHPPEAAPPELLHALRETAAAIEADLRTASRHHRLRIP